MSKHNKPDVRKNISRIDIAEICRQYGLVGAVVRTKSQQSDKPDKYYIIAGLNDESISADPEEIIRRNSHNKNIFYPESFATQVTNDSVLVSLTDLTNYCRLTEFAKEMFEDYGVPLPEKLRVDEIEPMIQMHLGVMNPKYDLQLCLSYRKVLAEYFEKEGNKGKFKTRWSDFLRSDYYDPGAGVLKNFVSYLNRDDPQIDMKLLINTQADLKTVNMAAHDFRYFHEVMKKEHPEVTFAVSETLYADDGMVYNKDGTIAKDSPWGETVTYEEYCKRREETFVSSGYTKLINVTPSYWEIVPVTYKAVDEPIVAGVLNSSRLRYAGGYRFDELLNRGDVFNVNVPLREFSNFISLLIRNEIPYCVDNSGYISNPELDVAHVVFNTYNRERVNEVINRLLELNLKYGHVDRIYGNNRIPVTNGSFAPLDDRDSIDDILLSLKEKSQNTIMDGETFLREEEAKRLRGDDGTR